MSPTSDSAVPTAPLRVGVADLFLSDIGLSPERLQYRGLISWPRRPDRDFQMQETNGDPYAEFENALVGLVSERDRSLYCRQTVATAGARPYVLLGVMI